MYTNDFLVHPQTFRVQIGIRLSVMESCADAKVQKPQTERMKKEAKVEQ